MNKELPIIFNTEMVKAILDGRKVCTRRPIKCQRRDAVGFVVVSNKKDELVDFYDVDADGVQIDEDGNTNNIPYKVGDLLYVRENWRVGAWDPHEQEIRIDFKAGDFQDKIYRKVDDWKQFEKLWVQSVDDAENAALYGFISVYQALKIFIKGINK